MFELYSKFEIAVDKSNSRSCKIVYALYWHRSEGHRLRHNTAQIGIKIVPPITLNKKYFFQCILMEDKNVGIIGTGLIGKKTVQKLSGLCNKVKLLV